MKYDYFSVYCSYTRDMMNNMYIVVSERRDSIQNFYSKQYEYWANIKIYTRELRFYLCTTLPTWLHRCIITLCRIESQFNWAILSNEPVILGFENSRHNRLYLKNTIVKTLIYSRVLTISQHEYRLTIQRETLQRAIYRLSSRSLVAFEYIRY